MESSSYLLLGKARVDDEYDSIDGKRSLGNIRAYDNLSARWTA